MRFSFPEAQENPKVTAPRADFRENELKQEGLAAGAQDPQDLPKSLADLL
jgi:hypothetical protein